MEIHPLGDSALLIRLPGNGEPTPSMLARVQRLLAQLRNARLPGVIEFVPAFASIAIFFDPARIQSRSDFLSAVDAAGKTRGQAPPPPRPRKVIIPICYDAEFGFDLQRIARRAHLSIDRVIALHKAPTYRVYFLGFAPGFPYLGGLPNKLVTPRRARPHAKIPGGSVAIGGSQCGIYPAESPGGWNVIGRTPLRLFEAQRKNPALLRMGDEVRFRAIDRAEFEAMSAA